jgi:hypothetical protein
MHRRGQKIVQVLVGKPRGKRPLRRGLNGRTESEQILERLALCVCGVDSVGSGQGPVASSCEHGEELSGSGATELDS